ncbi:MAG: exodeoxyribonuclease VII large subunit [Gammaproteobacteria bacterium]|nr:exodeoxyribonuclease VII large subunit [Gammaproteobacteria bacterium]
MSQTRDFYTPPPATKAAPKRPQREIFSVSRLNREVRGLLEGNFPLVWVEAEISNLSRPASGHWYFTLKDPSAQIRCAMFRGKNSRLRFQPDNGDQVLIRAQLSLYEARGDYQMIVEHMEEAGDGALRRAFEQLKQRLELEGLFDETTKRPLPTVPTQIGVITSPTSAAVRDILQILERRFPSIPVVIYPVVVQGTTAAGEIERALKTADKRNECDVLIVARGGGSLEDLMAFNDERVARAIHKCSIPVVSGVGHEIDFTIADFVADLRAPTPSGAAELVSPDRLEWQQRFTRLQSRLHAATQQQFKQGEQQLGWLSKRLQQQHPGQQLRQQTQRLDELEQRLQRSLKQRLQQRRSELAHIASKLQLYNPQQRIQQLQATQQQLNTRLQRALQQQLQQRQQQLQGVTRALDAVSPLATLGRGFSITRNRQSGRVLRDIKDAAIGDTIETTLAQGQLLCEVTETIDDE